MNRCISTLGCPDLSVEDALQLADHHGLAAIEIRALAGERDLPAYLERTYKEPEAFAAAVRKHRPTVFAFNTSFSLLRRSPQADAALIDHVRWADAAGIQWLRAFDGKSDLQLDEAVESAAAAIDWWRAERQKHGWRVDLIMETHDTFSTAEAMRALLRRIPSLAVLWDPHNMWRHTGEDPLDVWPAVRANTRHVHVKDSLANPAAVRGYTYVLPGSGEFPMKPLRERLATDGYTGLLSLEWERLWHPELPPLELALDAALGNDWW